MAQSDDKREPLLQGPKQASMGDGDPNRYVCGGADLRKPLQVLSLSARSGLRILLPLQAPVQTPTLCSRDQHGRDALTLASAALLSAALAVSTAYPPPYRGRCCSCQMRVC